LKTIFKLVPTRRQIMLVSFAAALGCARATLPVAGPADVDRASTRWPGTSATDLAQGRSLYQGHCAGCHLPVMPHAVAPQQWPGHVVEMKRRAHLSEEEAELITRYLVTMADTR
jgi:mono/diheme cytochrome c family protein